MSLKDTTKRPELAKHDATVLDLAFVMDCTGSMGAYIEAATQVIIILIRFFQCVFDLFFFKLIIL